MSSVSVAHNEAFADIKEEIAAEAAADPTKKKLGVMFWVCCGFIVLVAVLATIANLLPLPNPDLGNYSSVQNGGPELGPPAGHGRPLPRHPEPADLRCPGLARRRLRRGA